MDRTSRRCSLALVLCAIAVMTAACSRQPGYPEAPQHGADIVIDESSLPTAVPRFFTYRYANRNINFFVLKLETGVASYLDACVTCYPKRLGYECRDGYVHCRACGMNYSVYRLEKGIAGCYPIRINGRSEKGKYLIALSELQKHAGKF